MPAAEGGPREGSLGLVIPAYRPDPDLLVPYARALLDELAPREIRVELDGPAPEGCIRDLEAMGATVHRSGTRRGKGAAVRDGFDALDADVLAFTDDDGSTPPHALAQVIQRLEEGYDVSVGSRRHPEADTVTHQTRVRAAMGDVLVRLARWLLPIRLHDYQCGAKALRRGTWEALRGEMRETGFAWDLELVALAAHRGHDVVEVPIEWHDRPGSRVHPVTAPLGFLRALVAIRRRLRGSPP